MRRRSWWLVTKRELGASDIEESPQLNWIDASWKERGDTKSLDEIYGLTVLRHLRMCFIMAIE